MRAAAFDRITGDYAAVTWGAAALGVLVPQLLWFKAIRHSIVGAVGVGLAVNAGIWLDRFSIIVAGMQRDHLPSVWGDYAPTLAETGLLAGTLGLFAALLLLFVRYLPVISMFETRHDEHEDRAGAS